MIIQNNKMKIEIKKDGINIPLQLSADLDLKINEARQRDVETYREE